MVFPLIVIEQLLTALMMIIACRSFFTFRKQAVFTDPLFLVTALIMSLIRWAVPSWPGILIAAAAGYAGASFLFKGEVRDKILFGLIVVGVWSVLYACSVWILRFCRIGLTSPVYFRQFLQVLFCQLLAYLVIFISGNVFHRRKYGLSCYLALLPVLISLIPLFIWQEFEQRVPYLEQAVPLVFLLLLLFDFGCLALMNWMIMNLNTRANLRLDQIERENLVSKYEILEDQYQSSFSFLHQLLSLCAALDRDISVKDRQAIMQQTEDIADLAFREFNAVAISTPVLNRELEKRKALLHDAGILVSTVIRSDYFALMTFDEQELLFARILDFVVPYASRASGPSRIIVIKSGKVLSDLMLVWVFSSSQDPSLSPGFEKLRQFLSGKFHAGLKSSWNPQKRQAQLTALLPAAMPEYRPRKSIHFK
ncbi:MAG: hypothetical protein HUJ54_00530 [Erysipelotrichaceae bacterium]|nr:hypothetical protein [Erysipelotrichaceae bacterium]